MRRSVIVVVNNRIGSDSPNEECCVNAPRHCLAVLHADAGWDSEYKLPKDGESSSDYHFESQFQPPISLQLVPRRTYKEPLA